MHTVKMSSTVINLQFNFVQYSALQHKPFLQYCTMQYKPFLQYCAMQYIHLWNIAQSNTYSSPPAQLSQVECGGLKLLWSSSCCFTAGSGMSFLLSIFIARISNIEITIYGLFSLSVFSARLFNFFILHCMIEIIINRYSLLLLWPLLIIPTITSILTQSSVFAHRVLFIYYPS